MNGGTVRKKNQELIEAAVKKTELFSDKTARWLRTSKNLQSRCNCGNCKQPPHTSAILNEIEKKLRDHGYSVSFSVLMKNLDKKKRICGVYDRKWSGRMLITIPGNTDGHLILPEKPESSGGYH